MTDRSYYLDDFVDEISPVRNHSLAEWAAWLAGPDADWDRDAPAADGTTYGASVIRWLPDIVATRTDAGWSFSRNPSGFDFIAVRFGPGMGWDAENILSNDDIGELRAWFADNDAYCDDVEYLAVGVNEPDVALTFRAGPPPSLAVETVQ